MKMTEAPGKEKSKGVKYNLPKALDKYKNSNFELQQRAGFLYHLTFIILFCLVLIVTYIVFLHKETSVYTEDYFYSILLPILVLFGVVIASFLFLLRGHFKIAVHLLLITILAATWFIMLMDRNDILSRLDTIAFAMAGLTILPLAINRHKGVIVMYILINLGMLLVLFGVLRQQGALPDFTTMEFVCDNSIAFLFIGIVSYNIFKINKETHEKATAEFNEKLDVEKALSESERRYRSLMENMTGKKP